jgi:hypothetical protein
MHLCILTGAIWVIGSGVLALVEIPVIRLYAGAWPSGSCCCSRLRSTGSPSRPGVVRVDHG